ncbi:MAG TPA: glyceraldehyde 3-phosphate dehydrogenase NAD-binding domain-containing protein [Pilimelia sp.]|nr:glyceraldehyde 3-phosphate dehydrogenase NAD-binding domain-containing protein [Pilimelia sp.]
MTVRVAINGFGRIGRSVWRTLRARPDVRVVAVNDLADAPTLAHLLRYDTLRGRLEAPVTARGDRILVEGEALRVFSEPDPARIPWSRVGVDVVLESTGRFFRRDDLVGHLAAGAHRVLLSAAGPDPDATLIWGINEHQFDPARHRIVSPGCCTTNAVAPVLAVLGEHFGVRQAQLTSIHAYDSTHSALHDGPHANPRTGRAAAVNIVPVRAGDTVRAVSAAFPALAGRFDAFAVRVPAAIGCAADLVVRVDRTTSRGEVNAALAAAAASQFKLHLGYTEEPIVSSDILGAPESCVIDGGLTSVVDDSVKIFGWYDNEWGYANRLADLLRLVGAVGHSANRPPAP